jgi:hypothetical protein
MIAGDFVHSYCLLGRAPETARSVAPKNSPTGGSGRQEVKTITKIRGRAHRAAINISTAGRRAIRQLAPAPLRIRVNAVSPVRTAMTADYDEEALRIKTDRFRNERSRGTVGRSLH